MTPYPTDMVRLASVGTTLFTALNLDGNVVVEGVSRGVEGRSGTLFVVCVVLPEDDVEGVVDSGQQNYHYGTIIGRHGRDGMMARAKETAT